jgi:alpha-glucosidase
MLLKFKYFFLIFISLSITHVSANYTFLGDVSSFKSHDSGIEVICTNGNALQIQFLLPQVFRLTLVRNTLNEPLLSYPLVDINWSSVEFELKEYQDRLELSTHSIDLIIEKFPCRFSVFNKQGQVIMEDEVGLRFGWDGNEVRTWKKISGEEIFYGLGPKSGNLNRRGSEWICWNSDIPFYDSNTDPLYQSIPFFIGIRENQAYGIYLNNSYKSTFNFGAGNLRYYSFSVEGGNLDYFFIYGPQVSKVVELYTKITGKPHLPPLWSLGYQQCRWSYYPESRVLNLARTFRENKIPADVIYLDIHYMDGYRIFTWDNNRFPEPEKMIKNLEAMGFKVVVIIDPGVKKDSTYDVAVEGLADDYFLKYPDGQVFVGEVWPGPSYFPDFSKPQTQVWWGNLLGGLLEQGIKGFWNDMNEPAVWGKAFPLEVLFYDMGNYSSQKKMHNLYGFLMSKAAYDAFRVHMPNKRPFLLTRAGFAGEQKYAAVWTGDNVASEEHLELGIRMMLSSGISGVPFIGTDVGGFGGTPSPELFSRWLQMGIFSPLFRSHSHYNTPDQEPWAFGEEFTKINREIISLRYKLLPYLYTLFWEAKESGVPILRPLFWYHQDDPNAHTSENQHQFYFGEKLLAAPVTRTSTNLKKVYLPEGKWLNINNEKMIKGPVNIISEAGLNQIPIFLRNGAIIPMQQAMQFVGEKQPTELILEIFADSSYGNFILYEDDGISFNYEKEMFDLTEFEVHHTNKGFQFSRNVIHDKYENIAKHLNLRFHHILRDPKNVSLNNRKLARIDKSSSDEGYFWDAKNYILTIQFMETVSKQVIQFE